MGTDRILLFLAIAACSASTFAQLLPVPGPRTYLGLNLARGNSQACATTALVCERERPTNLYAGTMFSKYLGAEFGVIDTGPMLRSGVESRTHGLNLSLVGRARIAPSLGVFGKVGTTYGRSDTTILGHSAASGAEQGFGLSFGGGVSYDITPQLSATVEWDSHDLRLSGGREPVRSTSLGLQLRY